MTIRGIRNTQLLCATNLVVFVIALLITVGQIILDIHGFSWAGHALIVSGSLSGLLLLLLTQLRCPVCKTVFIGRRSRLYFTPTCRNCGRRAGDTA